MIVDPISVVLPVFNEGKSIEMVVNSTLAVVQKLNPLFEIILVNDNSTDGTPSILKDIVERHNNIIVIENPKNLGYGATLRKGFLRAKYPLLFYMDSDGQYDLSEVYKLIEFIDRYDIVTGYRVKRSDPILRRILGAIYNFFVRMILGISQRDINCGYKLFRKEVLDGMQFLSEGAAISAEIFFRGGMMKKKIKQVEISHYSRKHGEGTGAKPRVAIKALYEIIRLKIKYP